MTTAKYSIFPANTADIPVLVELLYSLKTALTFNRVLFKHWPNEAAQKALYRTTLENTLAQISTTESLKAVDDETGEIIGYVAVTRESPTRNPPTEQKKQHSNAEGGSGSCGQEQMEDLNEFHPEVYAAAVRACLELQRRNEIFEHIGTNNTLFFEGGGMGSKEIERHVANAKRPSRNYLCWREAHVSQAWNRSEADSGVFLSGQEGGYSPDP